ncbi:MAG TPA: hypothetical protein DCS87_10135 [Rheinheimera sp.]|nr:hypothetical protein [Rheinheimera sp.]
MNRWRHLAGFTLMELMVVLAIIGIGMLVAVPSYQGMVERNRLSSQVNEFQTAFNYARSEAIRLNTYVVLCQSIDGTVCSSPTSGVWAGWLVRTAGAAPGGETGPVLRSVQYGESNVVMTSDALLASNSHAIRFSPQGLIRSYANSSPLSSAVKFCVNDDSNTVYQLQFSSGGQSTVELISEQCN